MKKREKDEEQGETVFRSDVAALEALLGRHQNLPPPQTLFTTCDR